ncbi:MAG: iron-only hydrogenase system regulator [Eubacteriaceae bacterium]|jgi:putative iron-only hydrogenase system regulator|nr:iron-only hydrogenase system regulator [Eubacteriaceae bacterium]
MKTRIAVIGIILESGSDSSQVNRVLHDYRDYIIGRLGIPYRDKDLSVISIIMDAPVDVTTAMSGRLGMLTNVAAKVVYSKKAY